MTRRILIAPLLLVLALPAVVAAATPLSREAEAPPATAAAASDPTGSTTAGTAPEIPGSAAVPDPAPQDGFQGCPFEDLFWFAAPVEACDNMGAGCDPLCAAQGGTLIFGVTQTGADCTCVCCRT
jgi:hypothetical protein